MFFWWFGPGWGWLAGLLNLVFWVAVIFIAVQLIRGELPSLQQRMRGSPALKLLEERYARGEISREEFLERRAVLLQPPAMQETGPPPPGEAPAAGPSGQAGSTEPLPPS